MANVLKRTGIILSVAGILWFCYVIAERYHDPVPEISAVFAAMALAAAFVGLLVFALGEVCRSLQAIESTHANGHRLLERRSVAILAPPRFRCRLNGTAEIGDSLRNPNPHPHRTQPSNPSN